MREKGAIGVAQRNHWNKCGLPSLSPTTHTPRPAPQLRPLKQNMSRVSQNLCYGQLSWPIGPTGQEKIWPVKHLLLCDWFSTEAEGNLQTLEKERIFSLKE